MTRATSRRGPAGGTLALAAALLTAACGAEVPTSEVQEVGTSASAVAEALATLPSAGRFQVEVVDLGDAGVLDGGLAQGSARFEGGFTLAQAARCGPSAPADCATLGSRAHLALRGLGTVRFAAPRTVLGLHLSPGRDQATALEALRPQASAGTIVLGLPSFKVLLTGLDASGQPTATVRAVPAAATYAGTRVDRAWTWADTSLLGEVWGLRVTVESPLPGLDTILLDNLASSPDYQPDPSFFTIALLPDTQKYVETPALLPLFEAQARFLADQAAAEHLVFISGLGDIVEHGELEAEWARADGVLSLLDGPVPHAWVVGNHDYQDQWSHPEYGAPGFLAHFPPTRFALNSWWLGASPDGLSSAQRFPTPAGDFLYLHLSVDSVPPTLAWAQGILDANRGLPTLVSTHAYLRESGRIPVPYLASTTGPAWPGLSADQVFQTLVAPNDQVFMVTCGHISAEHAQVSQNAAGHPVHEVLQDYQNRENGGEGFLRLLRFHPGRKEVRVVTWSPALRTFEVDADSLFTLPVDLVSRFR